MYNYIKDSNIITDDTNIYSVDDIEELIYFNRFNEIVIKLSSL